MKINIRHPSTIMSWLRSAIFVTKYGDKTMSSDDIREAAMKFGIQNAVRFEGKAQMGSVIGKIMGEFPSFRRNPDEVSKIVHEILKEINSWPLDRLRATLEERWPELLEQKKKKIEEKKCLPPLANVERFKEIRTRFAPNPDGPLHLGSAEPIIFCDEYAKMYEGKFILRFEDTSPDVKAPIPEMYDRILEDLEWLGVKVGETYVQSERLQIYYDCAVDLMKKGAAYVCTCTQSSFRKHYMSKKACPCRNQSIEDNLKKWGQMLDGTFSKGEAVVRIKTDLNHPNPAIRDWPAIRIASGAHPRTGDEYRVWPLYNFSCSIDDHMMEISHIIRGKEHEVNTTRQKYIYKYLGWEYPEIINVGRLGLEVGILSKSKIREGLKEGLYQSWDDPRLGTLTALRRRGIQPETIRELMIEIGPKPINATLSWGKVASINRKNIDETANRHFFVGNAVTLEVTEIDREYSPRLPLHPDHPERGSRNYEIMPNNGVVRFAISGDDAANLSSSSLVRLMGLFNVQILTTSPLLGKIHSVEYQHARDIGAPFIHWLPENEGIEAKIIMSDASSMEGFAGQECAKLKIGEMIQFERVGFVRVDNIAPFVAYFAHR